MSVPKIKIAVKIQGGFGTILLRMNFLHCLYEYIDDAELEIYACGHVNQSVNLAIFENQPSIKWYGAENSWKTLRDENSKKYRFALLLELDLYPKVIYKSGVVEKSPKLFELVEAWENFGKDIKNGIYYNKSLRRSKPYEYRKLISQRKHIMNSMDIDDIVGVGVEYSMPVNIIQNEREVLKNFGLLDKKFITLQRGINPKLATSENNKLWPVKYFNELIGKIKSEFPEYVIVQLGESEEHCVELEKIDVNLLGQTSWDDIKILLKYAYLHIDGECGMVHLRKALHAGPSLVFFGPTPAELFGYDGNFNMHTDVCKHWCAELRDDWEYNCILDLDKAPCVNSIFPDMAMDAIRSYLSNGDLKGVSAHQAPYFRNKNLEMLKEYGHLLDEIYANTYFMDSEIWDYELREVPVASLQAFVYNGKIWKWIPLEDCPAFRYLSGDEKAYKKNMEERENLENNIHSCERFYNLIDEIDRNGFNTEKPVLISSGFRIRDGQHRAAIWMHKYGKDSMIPVLMIYMRE